jgi:hypothetical protein
VTGAVRVAAPAAALRRALPAATLAAILLGCTGPVRSSPAVPPQATPVVRAPAKVVAAVPRPSVPADPAVDLGRTVDIRALDRTVSDAILAFTSTGTSIAFSANLDPHGSPDSAPDLWRVTPGATEEPELVWRNPERDHVLTALAGDLDTVAFVDMPVTGERAWALRVVTRDGSTAVLDRHPGDDDVSGLVPSASVFHPSVAWTAFDRGPNGPVSQLLVATEPDWTPRVLLERNARDAELWFPSLYGSTLVYTEVVYDESRSADDRHVYLWDFNDAGAEPRRLDTSGLATMPQLVAGTVVWKEADPGFNMFNWGRLFRYDIATETVTPMHLGEDRAYVNYPSVGARFVAAWGSNTTDFVVYDLVRHAPRGIERYPPDGTESVLRAHVRDNLIAWLWVDDPPTGATAVELRFASLPMVREPEP